MSRKIVKASAGTGKTYRLALEYIARLLTGEDYSEILFMTFTRSATAELKGRIFDFLKEIEATGREGELAVNIQKLYPDITLNIEEAGSIYRKLLLNKDKLKIYTIDSFTGNIFKKAVGPYLNVYTYGHINSKDEERVYRDVFSKLVAGGNFERVKEFLEKTADRNVDKYLNLIKKVSEERWKFSLIGLKEDRGDSEILKDDLYREVGEIFLTINELVEVGKKEIEKCLGPASKKIYGKFGTDLHPSEEVTVYILENLKAMREGKYYNGTQTRAKGVAYLKERLEESQARIWQLLDSLVYYEEILPYERDIIEIESLIRDIYDEIKFKEKGLTFADITNYTSEYMYRRELDLVRDGLVTENFYEIVGGKITTLFLDEAQDTSVSQWRIIEPIAKACTNVIIVGDEKQSIYSWRGGEKKLFMSMGDILGAVEDNLPMSYRSEYRIIDFINHFFISVNKNNEDWKYTEVKCSREEKQRGFVGVLTKATHEEHSLETGIAMDIKERFDGNYRGIGIISRKTITLDRIGEALKELGVPFVTENSMSITNHPCIIEVMRLLKYILRRDYFSLLEFLRGASIGIGDSHMNWLLHNKKIVERYLDGGVDYLETGGPKELEEILARIGGLMKLSYEKLGKRVVEDFAFMERYSASRDIKNIRFFLEIMEDMDNLSELLNYLEENELSENLKQVGITEENSVVLMSIHKSKGLEFHTEYMYIEDKPSRYKMTGFNKGVTQHQLSLMTKMDGRYEGVEDYLFTNSVYEKNIKDMDIYKYIEKTYKDEEINTLYVGMTRPVANLILCINPTSTTVKKEKVDLLKNDDIIVPIEKYFNITRDELLEKGLVESGQLLPYEEKEEVKSGYYIDRSIYKAAYERTFEPEETEELVPEEAVYTYDVAVELRRKEGLAIHYFLESLEDLREQSLEKARKLTYFKYGNMLGDERLDAIMKRSEKFLIKNKEIYDSRFTVYKELELKTVEMEGGRERTRTHIIDRLNVDHSNGDIIIYDYKSGRTRDEEQLKRYERVVLEKLSERKRNVEYKIIKKEFLDVR